MTEQILPKRTLKDDIVHFIFDWHDFPFDYWWRKKYNVPFGSKKHKEMNFIDMCIEYQEEFLLNKSQYENDMDDSDLDDAISLPSNNDVIKPTAKEIDDDYDNLDLSEFNKT